ncbi:MAG: signal recognition particle protein, partial [Alphaproteobacteria bacterium]
RILGMGDVVSLVEKAAETVDKQKAEALAKKMKKGTFDLEDLADQFRQMRKMGGMQGLMGLLPGVGKMKAKLSENLDDKMIVRQEAIIQSMTPTERRNPKLLNASRKRRIAKGAGLQVQDVNKLLKMHRQMSDVMKRFGKKGMKGLTGGMPPGAMPGMQGGGMPAGGQLPGLGGPGGSGGMPALGPDGLPPGFPKSKK